VVKALKNLEPGGRLVINAIRKEEIDKESLETRLSSPSLVGKRDKKRS
jgi:hypothetical protein